MSTVSSKNAQPKRRWFQFSLRTLLLFVLAVSIGYSWFAVKLRQARAQRKAVAAIEELGGWVDYDRDLDETGKYIPGWLRRLLGDDFFAPVNDVSLSMCEGVTDSQLARLIGSLPKLERLYLDGTSITDSDLVHLKHLTGLRLLLLTNTEVTDAGLVHLRGLTKLLRLDLGGTEITGQGLIHLKELTDLENLGLIDTPLNDAGLVNLRPFTKLRRLNFSLTQVTGSGLAHLGPLTNCELIVLDDCQIEDHALAHLKVFTSLKELSLKDSSVTDDSAHKQAQEP